MTGAGPVAGVHGWLIRPLTASDLDAALALQNLSYVQSLRDGAAAFASRMAIGAATCLGAFSDDALQGYVLAHPWHAGSPPPVDTVLSPPSGEGERVLYIHDLSVAAATRGRGLGRRLVEAAEAAGRAAGLSHSELVAVPGAGAYWSRLGYCALPVSSTGALDCYGAGARCMRRALR